MAPGQVALLITFLNTDENVRSEGLPSKEEFRLLKEKMLKEKVQNGKQ